MQQASHREKIISGLGGALSIGVLFFLTRWLEGQMQWRLLLVASMGATAVLLFAAPRVELARPWNVIGGHMVSALVGVSVHRFVPGILTGSALAAGLAISAMYYLRCLHPPGGATALVAVIGGAPVEALGYVYVLFPVGLGALLMVLIAIAFNYPLVYRRYPAGLFREPARRKATDDNKHYDDISHADFVAALAELDNYVDISERDLLRIYAIATRHHEREKGQGGL
jgi:CBS-domain-containing membrane protein